MQNEKDLKEYFIMNLQNKGKMINFLKDLIKNYDLKNVILIELNDNDYPYFFIIENEKFKNNTFTIDNIEIIFEKV